VKLKDLLFKRNKFKFLPDFLGEALVAFFLGDFGFFVPTAAFAFLGDADFFFGEAKTN
jgi:hypothetical protein